MQSWPRLIKPPRNNGSLCGVRSPARYGRNNGVSNGTGWVIGNCACTCSSSVCSSGVPVNRVTQRRQLAPASMAPMVYQRSGSAWQKLCTALAGLPAAWSVMATMAALVPRVMKPSPALIAPMPTAATGLSPPPPAITTSGDKPSCAAALAVRHALAAPPSTNLGICSRVRPVACTMGANHSRCATSNHKVPAASDISLMRSALRRKRR